MKACFQIAECSLSSAKILIFFYFMAFSLAFFALFKKKSKDLERFYVMTDGFSPILWGLIRFNK